VVTVPGVTVQAVRRIVRRTTVRSTGATGTFPLEVVTTAGRSGGCSVT